MNWYMAKIVFRIICGEGSHAPQFDEQLRLINGSDEKEAFEKAKALGEREEDMFFNQRDELVKWQFINVAELYKIPDLIDGAELYSRVEEADQANAYIDVVNKKAAFIHSKFNRRVLEAL